MKQKILFLFLLLFSYSYSQDKVSQSLEESEVLTFTIYPNPVQDSFSLKLEETVLWVKIYNIFGKQVALFSAQERYNISHLKKGMYLLRLETEKSVAVRKLAVK